MIIDRPRVAELTVVHVEDEAAFQYLLEPLFRQKGLHYERVSLLSETLEYLEEPEVAGFIFDLRLPQESPARFAGWAGYERTPEGLIRRIRNERPDLPIVVLTDYPDDTPLRRLIQARILRPGDVLKKSDQGDESLEALVERFQEGRSAAPSQVKKSSDLSSPTVAPASMPELANRPKARLQAVSLPGGMDLRLLHLAEKKRRGLLDRAAGSLRPGEIPVVALVTDLDKWKNLAEVRPGVVIPRASGQQWIVTGRIPADRAEFISRQSFIVSLEAGETIAPCLGRTREEVQADGLVALPLVSGQPGKGVVIGIVDNGCAFGHPSFLTPEGETRVRALWHQDGPSQEGETVLSGAFYTGDRLQEALAKGGDPYGDLEDYDLEEEAHGTMVMDVAGGLPGVAPAADLAFVELTKEGIPWGREDPDWYLGNSVNMLEAVTFLFDQAGDRPCVVNLSLGTNLGPHDGTSLVEFGLDELVNAKPNRAVVVAAGNYYGEGSHTSGTVSQGGVVDLEIEVGQDPKDCVLVDLWYDGGDRFIVELVDPDGLILGALELEDARRWVNESGDSVAEISHTTFPTNGDNRIRFFLEAGLGAGIWTLRLKGEDVNTGIFHAWQEGNDRRRLSSRFVTPTDDCTLGCMSCGRESVVVAAYNAHDGCSPCSFSSTGPTRDGREKPDISAPGERIRMANSRDPHSPVIEDGTSFAAPVVAGVVAVMLAEAEAVGVELNSARIQEILQKTARKAPPTTPAWDSRYGYGRIDARAAVLAVQKLRSRATGDA